MEHSIKMPAGYTPRPYRPMLARAIRAAETLQTKGTANYVYDVESDQIIWGEGARDLLGDALIDAVKDAKAFEARKDEGAPNWRTMMAQKVEGPIGGNIYLARYHLDRKSSEHLTRWVEDTGYWHENEAGEPIRAEGALRLICENIGLVETPESLMHFDPVTKCLNENGLMLALEEAMAEAEKNDVFSAFVQMEIDGVERANTNLGLRGGDELMREAAHTIAGLMRQGDVIGRMPGARFGIIVRQCSASDLKTAISRFLDGLRGQIFKVAEAYAVCDARAGAVLMPVHAQNPQQAVARSLDALLLPSANSQNGMTLYTPENGQDGIRLRAAKYARKLVEGLRENKVSLALQPVMNEDGRTLFKEGLVRLYMEQDNVVDAAAFINIAEKYGLSRFVDLRALELALHSLRMNPQMPVSLNVSGETLTDPEWRSTLKKALNASPTLAKKLIFEIPFRLTRRQLETCGTFCTEMRQLGCQIALDNIDVNRCTPSLMETLNPDYLKLDSSKLSDRVHPDFARLDDAGKMDVDRLVELANTHQAQLIVTRLDDPEYAALLAGHGLNLQQGKAIGLPVASTPPEDKSTGTAAA